MVKQCQRKYKRIIVGLGLLGVQLLFLCSSALAQSVSGVVTDAETGQPFPGVNIIIKGTTNGTSSGANGQYSLSVNSPTDTLVFSFIGYETQTIPVNGRTEINVVLEPAVIAGEEMVVIGYGVQQKSDVTGSVGSVGEEALKKRTPTSVTQALAGRISGVNVSINSGRPGGRANIRIRGNTSVSNSNQPLYVIDGVILPTTNLANGSSPIDFIAPGSIASIEVLKDASATAIYGARGANGVILITTKKGGQNGGTVSYNSYVSVGTLYRKLDMLNAEEFLRVEEIAYKNAKKFDPAGFANGKYTDPRLKRTDPRLFDEDGNPLYDKDWQELSSRDAITQSHQLSFTNGDENGSYGIYLGYLDEEGVMKQSWLKRYSGRIFMDSQLNDWLHISGNVNFNAQEENQIDPLGGGGIIPMRQALETLPIIPVKYADGSWASNEDYPGMEGGGSYLNIVNERIYRVDTQTLLGSLKADITLTDHLVLRSTFGTNIIDQKVKYYAGRDLNFISRSQKGVADVSNDQYRSWQFENYLTYKNTFSDIHSIDALLGISWQNIERFGFAARAYGFLDNYFKYNNLGVASNPQPPSSHKMVYSLNSYFTRVNYSYNDKYLVTVTGRVDGSSKFGSQNRYAFFPSAALGWRISEEQFMEDVSFISNLKLRASYGVTGNSAIPAYRRLAILGNYTYILNGKRVVGVGINSLANPTLQWEKTYQFDAGLEVGLFDSRVQMTVDVYRKLSTDMLLDAPVPASSGYSSVFKNIGSMVNKGIEFSLKTYNIDSGDFQWNTTFNISINHNEVKKLTGGADIISGPTIIREGEPVNSFFGYVRLGTWGTDEKAEAAKYNRLPGDIKYKDVNQDDKINQADRVIIGKGTPDGYGSLINSFSYKNFALTVDIQFMYGNDVMFSTIHSTEDRQGIANSLATVLNAWTPENQNTPIAQLRPIQAGYDTNYDSHRLKDGSFIRGRNLLLSYRFSQDVIDPLGIRNLRLYASISNFFLVTDYPGYDPEVSTNGAQFAQGIARYAYPKPRVYTLGLNIKF